MNIRLTLEYDGTGYAGWQRQDNAMTVQQRVEEAIAAVTGERAGIVAAGRTDAGVHALGQVCHFHTGCTIPPGRIAFALNAHLPPDIRVTESRQVPDAFHARYDARGKHYRYTLFVRPVAPALERGRVWHIPVALDAAAMTRSAAHFVGEHDFSAFMDAGSPVKSAVRTLTRADVTVRRNHILFDFEGTGFLYRMVRIIAGTLVEVGQGKRDADSIPELLRDGDRSRAGVAAPARGLCLMRVYYDGDKLRD
jgi:tRNA pseudouridine38-40 synthase